MSNNHHVRRLTLKNSFIPDEARDRALGMLWADLNGWTYIGSFQGEDGSGLKDRLKIWQNARKIHGALIRRLVDEWLSTGFNEERTFEEPFKRFLPPACGGAMNCRMIIGKWIEARPKELLVGRTGEFSYVRDFVREKYAKTSEEEAVQHAGWQMAMLLHDPFKWAIAKCPRCSAYYFRRRIQKLYKRPTFCSECRRSATASRRMREKREEQRTQALKLAAKALMGWSTLTSSTRSRYANDERDYLALRVERLGLTRKWVSRNMTTIENLVYAKVPNR